MSDPYASPPLPAPPYGGPQIPPQYAPPPAAAMPPPPSPFDPAAPDEPYARWWQRVVAFLIDTALQIPFQIAQFIGLMIAIDGGGIAWSDKSGFAFWVDPIEVTNANLATTSTLAGLVIASVAGLASSVFVWWNMVFRQGRRGASIGKACLNLMVVSEEDGHPIGALMTFVRGWVHLLDLAVAGLGYLWPLWDSKRQTFADMIMHTAVLHLPPEPPRARETGVKAW